jgi:hypothetical protein
LPELWLPTTAMRGNESSWVDIFFAEEVEDVEKTFCGG